MSIKIISSAPKRAISGQSAPQPRRTETPPSSLAPLADRPAFETPDKPDAVGAAMQVDPATFAPFSSRTGDSVIVELERIMRMLDHDAANARDPDDRRSIDEGRRFIQEYNRRLRMALDARQEGRHKT